MERSVRDGSLGSVHHEGKRDILSRVHLSFRKKENRLCTRERVEAQEVIVEPGQRTHVHYLFSGAWVAYPENKSISFELEVTLEPGQRT